MSMKIAVIAGDGIGPEVIQAGLNVLEAAAPAHNLAYELTHLPYGGEHYLKTGEVISDEHVEDLRAFDSIFLGAVGHPDVKPGVLEKGLLLKLRFALDQYINLRPVKLLDGVRTTTRSLESVRGDIRYRLRQAAREALQADLGAALAIEKVE